MLFNKIRCDLICTKFRIEIDSTLFCYNLAIEYKEKILSKITRQFIEPIEINI